MGMDMNQLANMMQTPSAERGTFRGAQAQRRQSGKKSESARTPRKARARRRTAAAGDCRRPLQHHDGQHHHEQDAGGNRGCRAKRRARWAPRPVHARAGRAQDSAPVARGLVGRLGLDLAQVAVGRVGQPQRGRPHADQVAVPRSSSPVRSLTVIPFFDRRSLDDHAVPAAHDRDVLARDLVRRQPHLARFAATDHVPLVDGGQPQRRRRGDAVDDCQHGRAAHPAIRPARSATRRRAMLAVRSAPRTDGARPSNTTSTGPTAICAPGAIGRGWCGASGRPSRRVPLVLSRSSTCQPVAVRVMRACSPDSDG